ncbi:hypothetical protein [Azospirillum argentinense]
MIVSAKAWLLRCPFGFVGIADATDEGFDASVGKAFHVPNGNDF